MFCLKCGFPIEKGDRFCGDCGLNVSGQNELPPLLKDSASFSEASANENTVSTTELASARKHVTVIFADISGFTAMSEKLDPEDVSNMMNDCLSKMAEIVTSYGGYVDKFIGDCIMALFGAPLAHENDAELAVRAALEMNQSIIDYNATLPIKLEKPLTLHTGLNSGLVVAGNVGSGEKLEYTVMGDTVNLASRLESSASSGEIFISKYTYNLVKGIFDFNEREPMQVKGKKAPVEVYEVLGIRSAKDRRSDLLSMSSGKLIGRDHEMAVIKERIDQAFKAETQVALLKSDAGIGKSRIHKEVEAYLTDKDVDVIYSRCHSFSSSTSYFLFTEIIKDLFNIDSDDLPETIPEKVVSGLSMLVGEDIDFLSDDAKKGIVFFGHILGAELKDTYDISIDQMNETDVKDAVLQSIQWFFGSMARMRPLILILEDLHFADRASLDVILHLMNNVSNKAFLLLLYLRPEDKKSSSNLGLIARKTLGDLYTEIELENLTAAESDALVKSLLNSEDVPADILTMVRERADGNPSFIEAIVQALKEEEVIEVREGESLKIIKPLDSVEIPGSIQGLVVSALDRLSESLKNILQWSSVIGPVFDFELLKKVACDSEIENNIQVLTDKEFIFESKSFPEIEYSFKSVLVQECAYAGMLLKMQREMHLTIARAIEDNYGDRLDEHYEILARHYHSGQDFVQAYEYSVKAGMKSRNMHAPAEAIISLNNAIELFNQIDDSKTPITDVYGALAEVYEVNGDLDLAIEYREKLAETLDDTLKKGDGLRQIGRIWEKKGDRVRSLEMYAKASSILGSHPDSVEMGRVLMNESWVFNRMRKSEEALDKCNQALELFEKHQASDDIAEAHNNLAVFHEQNGDLDLALEHNEKSLELFLQIDNKRKIGNTYLSLGYVHSKRNSLSEALDSFEKSTAIAENIGNRLGMATSLMAKGRCYLDLSDYENSESVLRRSLQMFRDADLGFRIVANDLSLAKVYVEKGDTSMAMDCLNEAREIAVEQERVSDLAKVDHMEGLVLIKEGSDPSKKFADAIKGYESLGRSRDAAEVQRDLEAYSA